MHTGLSINISYITQHRFMHYPAGRGVFPVWLFAFTKSFPLL